MTKRALVLFGHGARDPRWAAPFQRLQESLQAQLTDTVVALAFLELMTPGLPELVQTLTQQGCNDITVVPVFFGQGGHVLRDLPVMVEQIKSAHPDLTLKVAQAVGEDAAILQAIALYCMKSLELG